MSNKAARGTSFMMQVARASGKSCDAWQLGRPQCMMARVQPLPIDPVLATISESLAQARRLVLEAPPGAGKTTRVPWALLDSCEGEVIVTEPRRLAARMAARRVASERGERLGERVGYSVRFE